MNAEPANVFALPFDDDSQDSIALRFSAKHADNWRYCDAWKRWLSWDGRRWRHDDVAHVRHVVRKVCRDAAKEVRKGKAAAKSAATVRAVEYLAQADPRHATKVDDWDRDPWLLATPDGTVDLRTGKLRPADPSHLLTRLTGVGPKGKCPTWLTFLDRITDGNEELVGFLQRVCGYLLTGETREHAMFFFYGTGGNGKGTFLNTITSILGDYASVASIDAFTATNNDRHSTDLAMMRGARLVSAQETDEGRRWAEARIKAMTGGDPITARFMYQDFFTYVPQFKLVIAGNHKPGLKSVDEAIRRRFHLVPFTASIPKEERDPRLPAKLREEWGGILAWMIEGCRAWQREGLEPPDIVRAATDEYLAGEDVLGGWIEERCIVGGDEYAPIAALYESWRVWCEAAGERPQTKRWLADRLRARGHEDHRATGGVKCLKGLRPRPDNLDPWGRPVTE